MKDISSLCLRPFLLRYSYSNSGCLSDVPEMFTPSSTGQILRLRGYDESPGSLPSGISCTGRSDDVLRGVELKKWFHPDWAEGLNIHPILD